MIYILRLHSFDHHTVRSILFSLPDPIPLPAHLSSAYIHKCKCRQDLQSTCLGGNSS